MYKSKFCFYIVSFFIFKVNTILLKSQKKVFLYLKIFNKLYLNSRYLLNNEIKSLFLSISI